MGIDFKEMVKVAVTTLYEKGILDEPFESVESLIDELILKKTATGGVKPVIMGGTSTKVDKGPVNITTPGDLSPAFGTQSNNPVKPVLPKPPVTSKPVGGIAAGSSAASRRKPISQKAETAKPIDIVVQ